jgi:antitoxin HigA-1
MIPENRIPTHPGEILREEFLEPLGVPQTALADKLDISVQRINEIVNGKRGITPETAWLFAGAFGTTPEFWTNLQSAHDLALTRPEKKVARIGSK